MERIIGERRKYRRTEAFVLACLVYHATKRFCARTCTLANDPLGKTRGQMEGAARSARQNIVEGSERAGTSKETELRLYDVARGSLQELAGDYEAYIEGSGKVAWRSDDSRAVALGAIRPAPYTGDEGADARHDFGAFIMEMRRRFAAYLEADDPVFAANAILRTIDRASRLLDEQMARVADEFLENGGFTERMSRMRIEWRDARNACDRNAPTCPRCGRPLRKTMARKGRNAGNPIWCCTGYPECRYVRNCDATGARDRSAQP